MPKKHLTDQFIKNLKPQDKRIEYYDQHLIDSETNTLKRKGVKGLFVRLTTAGNIYFYYSYWYDDKSKRYKIGDYPNIRLSEARELARELAGRVNQGIDPQAEKQAKKSKPQPKRFKDLADRYKKQHVPTLRESTQRSYTNRIDTELMPAFGNMHIKNISRGVIIELLEEIATERKHPTHSNRVRAILSSMFTFAVQRELAEYNPVKTVPKLGDEISRDRVLTEDEIKKLWQGFDTISEPVQSVLKILLLLGQRKTETCTMRWDDIKNNIWTIPKENTKADRTHYLPLPSLAVDIIEGLKNDSPYVFQSNINKGEPVRRLNDAFKQLAKSAGIEDARIHDLRRTTATYMAELGTDRTILGKVLNHKGLAGDSQVTARYDRYSYMEEKQTALNRWSHKLEGIISGETEANIHKIG